MKNRIFQVSRYRRLPPEIHVMLLGTLLTRGGYYMAWPFLSITLFEKFGLSAFAVGGFLAAATACGAFSGIYAGYLSDKYGRRAVISISTLIAALGYVLMSAGDSLIGYSASILAISMGGSHLEACCKALIGDRVTDGGDREFALYFRYFTLNVGVAVGALIGVTAGIASQFATFMAVSVVHLVYGVVLWLLLRKIGRGTKVVHCDEQISFADAYSQILGHRAFVTLLLCNMLVALVYANFDSTLVQYIARFNPDGGRHLVAWLIAVNAATVTIAQFPVLRLLEARSIELRLTAGLSLIFVAQVGFAFAGVTHIALLVLATIVLSLGELIVFPTFSVKIDRLTPDDMRGSYFGAGNLYSLGSAIAPLLGGALLQYVGGPGLFAILSMICLWVLALHVLASRREARVASGAY
ncbi:MDR family MFS transporter [Burkholderia sp. WSM2232]|uniref:MDR family MFS transporter n=1 Tax=Burkholderia sp. WSM2232 TaxID=944436 RepID=UPI000409E43E|nr:MFS transporter [Burkholderia sp. WSM2232]